MFGNVSIMRISILFVFLCLLGACAKKIEEKREGGYNPENIPSMVSYNDSIIYADSGKVQMKVIANQIMIFDNAKDPYTFFPKKAYLEQYDSIMNIVTQLWADSVWNYNKQNLWKLRGNVRIIKNDGKSYESDELFWDEANDRVYSDKFVIINEPGKATIRAKKFESNQNFTKRTFHGAKDGDLYFSDKTED